MPTAAPLPRDVAIETRFFWLRFRSQFVAALIVVILGIIAYGAYRLYQERRATRASISLSQAKTAADYQSIIDRYPNTASAAGAHLLLAREQQTKKQFIEANVTLQSFLNKYPNHELVPTARMAMAANLEAMGKTDEALAMYQQVATSYPKNFNAPLALVSKARLLKAKERTDEARQTYETILTQYRDSYWSREAMQELSLMKPKAAETPAATPTAKQPEPPPLLRRPAEMPIQVQTPVQPQTPASEKKSP